MSIELLTRRSFLRALGIGTAAVLGPFGCDRASLLGTTDGSDPPSTRGTPSSSTHALTDKDFSPAMGIMAPMITPMKSDLSIDYDGFRALIDWHAEQGVSGIFVASGSGEYDLLTEDEIAEMAAVALAHVAGDLPVLAGATNHHSYNGRAHRDRLTDYKNGGSLTGGLDAWTQDLADNRSMAQRIAATGVDGIFVTTPPAVPFELFEGWDPDEWILALSGYHSDDPEVRLLYHRLHGDIDPIVVDFITSVHDDVSCQVFGYEMPGDMSHYKLSPAAFAQLGQLPRMIAIKDTSDLDTIVAKAEAAQGTILIMDADEFTAYETLQGPASGAINITANVASGLYVRLHELIKQGDLSTASDLNEQLLAIYYMLTDGYMRSAKIVLGYMGLPIEEWLRYSYYVSDREKLRDLIVLLRATREEFEVPHPTCVLS